MTVYHRTVIVRGSHEIKSKASSNPYAKFKNAEVYIVYAHSIFYTIGHSVEPVITRENSYPRKVLEPQ